MFMRRFNPVSAPAIILIAIIFIGCRGASATLAIQSTQMNGSQPPLAVSISSASVVTSTVSYDEDIDGDLSDDPQVPNQFTLSIGIHSITATSSTEDPEYFSLVVPQGTIVESIMLNRYEDAYATSTMIMAIQEGATYTKPTTRTIDLNWIGSIVFERDRDQIGTNLLNDLFAKDDNSCFKGPLATGPYAVRVDGLNSEIATYSLNFVVTAAPKNMYLPFIAMPAASIQGNAICSDIEWREEDLGPFSLLLPTDMRKEEVQGIDSYVGKYTRNEMQLSFDYGWYSNAQNYYCDQPEYQESQIQLSGKPARIISFKNDNQVIGNDYRYIAGLYVPNASGDEHEHRSVDKLSVLIQFNNADDKAMANCILESVSFPD